MFGKSCFKLIYMPSYPAVCSLAATMALKDISRDCSDSMRPYAGQVIDAIHRSTVSGCLNPGECVRLMYPLGKMLSLLHPAPGV